MFKVGAVKHIEVPKFPELNVANIMSEYSSDERFMAYMPLVKAKGKRQCRRYMFNVFNTLYPTVLD